MNKLITTIGSMLFVCMIFTSCSSDKKSEENKAPKLTEKQIELKKGAEIFCEFFKIAIQIRDMETQYELTGEYEDEEKYLLIEEEYNNKDIEMSNFFEMYEKKYENDEDNLKIAQAEFNFFKKECEKCKSDIEKIMGWDTFFNSMEQEMLSDYDAAGNPIEENLDYGWSEFDRNNFLDDCNSENEMDMRAYCDCALEIVMSMYESYDEANELMTEDDVMEIAEACSYALDVTEGWSEVEQNEFIQACIAENDADFMPAYCDCALDIVMSIYDSPEEAESMTEDDVMEIAEACSYTFDM
jgi:hypothetical protein